MEEEKDYQSSQSSTTGKKSGSKSTYILVGLIVVLLIAAGAYIFLREQDAKERNAELMTAYSRLDSIGNELNDRILKIEELGGDIEELTLVRDSLEMEKESLKESRVRSNQQIRQLKGRVEGYKELLVMKDVEIEELRIVNEELLTENTELKTERNQLNQNLRQAQKTQEALTEKVSIASRLVAENIKVMAINIRGKEKEDEFRARQISQLKVAFSIAQNDVAPVEGKEILMRIKDENDNVLFDVARGSGTFVLEGKETFYTAKQQILFDNTQQGLTFIYDKGSEYLPGRYVMEIYTDGYLMGVKSFQVK